MSTKTGLAPTKSAALALATKENGVVMTKEMVYGGHKEAGGLTLPTSQTTIVQGKEVYTWTEMTYGFPDKMDGKTFEKP